MVASSDDLARTSQNRWNYGISHIPWWFAGHDLTVKRRTIMTGTGALASPPNLQMDRRGTSVQYWEVLLGSPCRFDVLLGLDLCFWNPAMFSLELICVASKPPPCIESQCRQCGVFRFRSIRMRIDVVPSGDIECEVLLLE